MPGIVKKKLIQRQIFKMKTDSPWWLIFQMRVTKKIKPTLKMKRFLTENKIFQMENKMSKIFLFQVGGFLQSFPNTVTFISNIKFLSRQRPLIAHSSPTQRPLSARSIALINCLPRWLIGMLLISSSWTTPAFMNYNKIQCIQAK